MGIDTFM